MAFNTFLTTLTLPDAQPPVDPASLFALLAQLPDPRKRRGRRSALAVSLTLMIFANLAGETPPRGIAPSARLRTEWLCDVLHRRRRRLPCATTDTAIAAKVDVADLNRRLAQFVVPPLPPLPAAPLPEVPLAARAQRHLALEGKTLRGTRRSGAIVQPAGHLLSVYDGTHHGTLAHQEGATKDHEIPGAARLIAGRDLRGCVVTADALQTQRTWWRPVRAQGGEYGVIVKKNQRGLRQELAGCFEGEWPTWLEQRTATTVNKGHGRLEGRQVRASTDLNAYRAAQWTDVAQVFQIARTIERPGKCTQEVVDGLTSIPRSAAAPDRLLSVVRAHWHLENRGHWRRDVTLGEDGCQVKPGAAAQVLASLNTAVLMLMVQLGVPNVAAQMREFAANPRAALALLFGAS